MSEENEVFDLNALMSGFGQVPLKYLIYGTGGSGKSTNTVSILPAYLAAGWQVIYVFTENNAVSGFKDGLKLYGSIIQPFLKKGNLFIADLTKGINEKNKEYLAKVDSPEKSQLTLGAVTELCRWFTEKPLVRDFTAPPSEAAKAFRGLSNLTTLDKESKVLLIIDGYSPIDTDTGGFSYWAQGKKKVENSPAFFGGLRGSGTNVMQSLFAALQTDLIVLGHDKLQGINLTDMLSGEKKEEAVLRRDLLSEQLQESMGYPALATSTTASKLLGCFSLVLHATDTRLANNAKLPRFVFDRPEDGKWYTRTNLNFNKVTSLYARKINGPEIWPQDWSKALGLTFLLNEQKIDAEAYENLINLTKQQKLI